MANLDSPRLLGWPVVEKQAFRKLGPSDPAKAHTEIMPLGRLLIAIGLVLLAVGLVVTFAGRLPLHLGRLPGDIRIHGRNFGFYFPLTTCILLSLVLTLVLWLLRR